MSGPKATSYKQRCRKATSLRPSTPLHPEREDICNHKIQTTIRSKKWIHLGMDWGRIGDRLGERSFSATIVVPGGLLEKEVRDLGGKEECTLEKMARDLGGKQRARGGTAREGERAEGGRAREQGRTRARAAGGAQDPPSSRSTLLESPHQGLAGF